MNSFKSKIKFWLLKNIDLKYFELFNSRYTFTTKFPLSNHDVVSDLFPLRIENGWNSYFELLNIPKLINPLSKKTNINKVNFIFFNSDGIKINTYSTELKDELKTTIDLKKLCKLLNIKSDGTFAVFHSTNKFISKRSHLSDRGYVGYENKKCGPIKGYVHGNYDAISYGKKFKFLGVTSFRNKNYNIQYNFDDEFTYELLWVNPSNENLKLKIFDTGLDKKSILKINRGGLKSYICKNTDNTSKRSIVVESKLNLARPIIFKYMKNSFDVFHG